MSYIGRGVDAISNVEKLDNITFNGGTTYALTKSSAAFTPVGANNILVSIDGVIQQGNFSVSTTNIVFDWSPTSSNTCDFVLHYGTGVLNVPADGAVSTAKIAADAVTGAKIADDQINSEHYVDGSIDTAHLGNLQVTTAKIAADAIDGTKLADDAVDSEHYIDASIDNAHLADDAVGIAELSATGTASSSTFLRGDNAWAAPSGGKLLQLVWATPVSANQDISTTTWTDVTGMTLNITPAATTSKIFVFCNVIVYFQAANSGLSMRIDRGGTVITSQVSGGYGVYDGDETRRGSSSIMFYDAPSSTSQLTYKIQAKSYSATDTELHESSDGYMYAFEIGA